MKASPRWHHIDLSCAFLIQVTSRKLVISSRHLVFCLLGCLIHSLVSIELSTLYRVQSYFNASINTYHYAMPINQYFKRGNIKVFVCFVFQLFCFCFVLLFFERSVSGVIRQSFESSHLQWTNSQISEVAELFVFWEPRFE